MVRQRLLGLTILATLVGSGISAAAVEAPETVSPGSPEAIPVIAQSCPTFSWGAMDGARAYELVVYALAEEGDATPQPVLRVRLPGSASGWTPALAQCLEPGRQYAWFIRALGDEVGEWSDATAFEVAAVPSAADVEGALRVLNPYLEVGKPAGAADGTVAEEPVGSEAPESTEDDGRLLSRAAALVTSADQTAIRGEVPGGTGINFGVHGVSLSADDGAAGVVGESTAASGDVFGVVGVAQSAAGAAGAFDNAGGGDILRGLSSGLQVFNVAGTGMVTAAGFQGDGSGLSGVDADTLDGLDSTDFLGGGSDVWVNESGDTMTGTLVLSPASGSALVTTAGNVGIGKLAPSELLDVGGNVNLDGNVFKNGSLFIHDNGISNTALGETALLNNLAGFQNTAAGFEALKANTGGFNNTAHGALALRINSTGNSNTAVGAAALAVNAIGNQNTAAGTAALSFNFSGSSNTAAGFQALRQNLTGSSNTAIGSLALTNNTTGTNNTAGGVNALSGNLNGLGNSAFGHQALAGNTVGSGNSAVGDSALINNSEGVGNSALGASTLFGNTTGTNNTAAGDQALFGNNVGFNNTAVGKGTLFNNSSGSGNTAVGFNAGQNATTGNDNIYLNNPGVAAESGTIRIGTSGTQTKAFMAGISGVTTGGVAVTVVVDGDGQLGTISSSRRFKGDVRDMAEASSGLLQLRPVTFRYRESSGDGSRPLQYGLIAEEVAEVYPELVQYSTSGKPQTVLYRVLSSLLLNEVQKQHRQIQAQEVQILELSARLERLEGKNLSGPPGASSD
jgi:hypothetical protein